MFNTKKRSPLTLVHLALITVVWWVVLFVIGELVQHSIPFTNTFSNYSLETASTLPMWFKRWANFDGGAYIIISNNGYKNVGLLQAYFPLYPMLMSSIQSASTFIFHLNSTGQLNASFIVGLGINIVCTFLFLLMFVKYLELKYETSVTRQVIFAFLFFPTSLFIHALYTESLFLLILVCCLYAFERQWWIRLSLGLILLTATRVVGVFLIPALLFDLLLRTSETSSIKIPTIIEFLKSKIKEIVFISLGAVGLFSYMEYLYLTFKDPLYFFHVQSSFGAGRQQSFVLFLQVMFRYFKIFWTARPFDWKYFAYTQEFVSTMLVLGILLYGVLHLKKLKLSISELAFSFGAFFLPTVTGNFSSMPRYILVCLPVFIVLGQFLSRHRTARIIYYIVCGILSIINIMLFIQGHWVA